VTNAENVEKIARELCLAAGKNPDATMRLGEPLSFAVGECIIVKPLIVPAWKTFSREARRLSMSDAEHAEACRETRNLPRRRGMALNRMGRSLRKWRIVLRRRLRRLQVAASLKTVPATCRSRAAISRWFAHSMPGRELT
jgi:hypothetical protein